MITKNTIPQGLPSVLAFDLGTHGGWAYIERGKIISGHRPLRRENRELAFWNYLCETFDAFSPSAVVYEHAPFQQGKAREIWHSQRGILALFCQFKEVEYESISVPTIKKHMTGKGNCGKNAVVEAVCSRGFDVADDNEADALGVLLTALETGVITKG